MQVKMELTVQQIRKSYNNKRIKNNAELILKIESLIEDLPDGQLVVLEVNDDGLVTVTPIEMN